MSDAERPSSEPVEVIERAVLRLLPHALRAFLLRHHELIKFAVVGATTFVFDMAIYYGLILTALETKHTTAKIVSGILATVLSYILNREWSFKHRGGRQRHHEALLFFAISGIGVLLAAAPIWVAHNLCGLAQDKSLRIGAMDFALGYIIGNFLQMAFRFWALRKFAYPVVLDELPSERGPQGPKTPSPLAP